MHLDRTAQNNLNNSRQFRSKTYSWRFVSKGEPCFAMSTIWAIFKTIISLYYTLQALHSKKTIIYTKVTKLFWNTNKIITKLLTWLRLRERVYDYTRIFFPEILSYKSVIVFCCSQDILCQKKQDVIKFTISDFQPQSLYSHSFW